uniref:Uncharacterized protein n=1 Tax=Escherichia coli TaxID=562 RepID=A0A7U0K7V9_ECOLX|nr:hypothetical protein [Escherichia coli]
MSLLLSVTMLQPSNHAAYSVPGSSLYSLAPLGSFIGST